VGSIVPAPIFLVLKLLDARSESQFFLLAKSLEQFGKVKSAISLSRDSLHAVNRIGNKDEYPNEILKVILSGIGRIHRFDRKVAPS